MVRARIVEANIRRKRRDIHNGSICKHCEAPVLLRAKFISMMVLAVSFIVLENMVVFSEEIGKNDEAEKLAERVRKIRSKNQ